MAVIKKRTWITKDGKSSTAWQLSYIDAQGKRHRKQFDTKREADAKRIEVEGAISKGTFRASAEGTTVTKAVDDYMKYVSGRHQRNERMSALYMHTIEGILYNYIAPIDRGTSPKQKETKVGLKEPFPHGIGNLKLAQLSARRVGQFRDDLRNFDVSVLTTRQILGCLSRVLNHAVGNDLVAVNVAKTIEVIGRRDEGTKKVVPPSKATLAKLLAAADEDFRLRLVFASASGLRASEQHALRWSNINLDNAKVTVIHAVDRFKTVETTKSPAGVREIPLASAVVTQLREWRLKSKHSAESDLVFPNTWGTFVNHNNMLKRKFRPLEEKAGVSTDGWHALRHFAISSWIDAGLTPKTIQTFAGHSTLTVTMDRYGHLFPSNAHGKAMDSIANKLFA